jgi:hypothetical protein
MRGERKNLGLVVDRPMVAKLVNSARAFDVERGGCYDACGAHQVQVWANPDDKPACWDAPFTPGAWGPSELVGDITWEWRPDDTAELCLEIYARELIDHRMKQARVREYEDCRRTGRPIRRFRVEDVISGADREQLFAWLETKARDLLRLAQLQPAVVGTKCPWCGFVLANGAFLNDLMDHIEEQHPERRVRSVRLGQDVTLDTPVGLVKLEPAVDFAQ